jgi:hypothetical protein
VLTAKAEKEVDGAPGRRSQAGLSSARSSPFLARPACPAATVGRSTPPPAAATRSAEASHRSRSPSATLPARLLTPRAGAGADDIGARPRDTHGQSDPCSGGRSVVAGAQQQHRQPVPLRSARRAGWR